MSDFPCVFYAEGDSRRTEQCRLDMALSVPRCQTECKLRPMTPAEIEAQRQSWAKQDMD